MPSERELVEIEKLLREVGSRVDVKKGEDLDIRELLSDIAIEEGDIRPIGEVDVLEIDQKKIASYDPQYTEVFGLDSGTTRPESYGGGVCLNVADAKVAELGSGSHHDVESTSTIVAAVYSDQDEIEETEVSDGEILSKIINVECDGDIDSVRGAVVTAAQKMAEGLHAVRATERDDVRGPLFFDGSIYPLGVLKELVHAKKLALMGSSGLTGELNQEDTLIDNYVQAITNQLDKGVPVIGVAKTFTTEEFVRNIEHKRKIGKGVDDEIPWIDDYHFMSDLLSPEPGTVEVTSWFEKSSIGVENSIQQSPMLGFNISSDREPEDYNRCFFYVALPIKQIVFRVECPKEVVRNEKRRKEIRRFVLRRILKSKDVPGVISRADKMASIGKRNSEYLKNKFGDMISNDRVRNYNRDGRFETFTYGE